MRIRMSLISKFSVLLRFLYICESYCPVKFQMSLKLLSFVKDNTKTL